MKKGDQQRRPPLNCRLIKEFDFFNENRSGPSNYYIAPALKSPLEEIIFPQIILNSPTSSAVDASAHRRKRKATRVDDDETSKKKKKKNKNPNSPQPDNSRALILLPPQIDHHHHHHHHLHHPRAVEQIEEHEPILLFEKKLELSDVKQSQNRLLITGSEKLMAALTEEERERVGREGEKSVLMEVMTRDPRGAEYRMRLRRWPAMKAIVLNHEWFKLASANGFQKGDSVQGWGYRAANRFRLDIMIVKNTITP